MSQMNNMTFLRHIFVLFLQKEIDSMNPKLHIYVLLLLLGGMCYAASVLLYATSASSV